MNKIYNINQIQTFQDFRRKLTYVSILLCSIDQNNGHSRLENLKF